MTDIGVKELKTEQDVHEELENHKGTTLVVINSVCGCAAGNARPAVEMAKMADAQPDNWVTVFAGQDKEATHTAREYINQPPSSPAIFLLKDGEVVMSLARHQIEGRSAQEITNDMSDAFAIHC